MSIVVRLSPLLVCLSVLVLAQIANGEQPCACSSAECWRDAGLPILSKIPYVNRLFKNVGVATCEHCDAHPDANRHSHTFYGEPIGVDFDFAIAADTGYCRTVCCEGECCESKCCGDACCHDANRACKACEFECIDCLIRPAIVDAEAASDSKKTEKARRANKANRDKHAPDETLHEMVDLAVQNAALQAQVELHAALLEQQEGLFEAILSSREEVLEAHAEAAEQRDEIIEALVEVRVENAALQAKLEMAQQREELIKALAAAHIENANLKHHVEMFTRREAERSSQLTAHENEPSSTSPPSESSRDKRRTARRNEVVR